MILTHGSKVYPLSTMQCISRTKIGSLERQEKWFLLWWTEMAALWRNVIIQFVWDDSLVRLNITTPQIILIVSNLMAYNGEFSANSFEQFLKQSRHQQTVEHCQMSRLGYTLIKQPQQASRHTSSGLFSNNWGNQGLTLNIKLLQKYFLLQLLVSSDSKFKVS